jgi:hypothetical protein
MPRPGGVSRLHEYALPLQIAAEFVLHRAAVRADDEQKTKGKLWV